MPAGGPDKHYFLYAGLKPNSLTGRRLSWLTALTRESFSDANGNIMASDKENA